MPLPPVHSTQIRPAPPLMGALTPLVMAHRPAFRQERVFRRAMLLLVGWLFAFSRKTMTQLLAALGLVNQDWSAWYRLISHPRVDYDQLTRCLFQETLHHVPADVPYGVVLDATPVPRHSKTMPGTFWGRVAGGLGCRVNLRRLQRFVNLAWLLPVENSYTRALPVRWFPALPERAVPVEGEPPRKEWEAGLASLKWVRQQLDAAGRKKQWVRAAADGAYDVNEIWRQLPARTILVVRCAKNRRLYELPQIPPSPRGRGRPAAYGPLAPHPQEWLHRGVRWQSAALVVRGKQRALKYHVAGPYLVEGSGGKPVFLLVVKGYTCWNRTGTRKTYRPPAYLLANALRQGDDWVLPAPAGELLEWVWQRWEVEVCHRELKSQFGIGELQCWSAKGSLLCVQWAVWIYAVLVLSGYRAWGLCGRQPAAPTRWFRGSERWSLNTLWQGYRQELWRPADFQALSYGSHGKWLENTPLTAGLWNAVWSCVRA
jgi:DDE superfamily endonuclease